MMLDIKPIRTPALSMREDILASFLNWIGRDYMLMLTESWGFSLLPAQNDGKLGSRIELAKGDLTRVLDKYIGVTLTKEEAGSSDQTLSTLRQIEENHLPIILEVHSMYLPYHRTYKKAEENHPHQILAIGIDAEHIFIIDPPWCPEYVSLSIKDFLPGIIRMETIEVNHSKDRLELIDILGGILEKITSENGQENMFEAMRMFASLLETELDIETETDGKTFTMESLRFNQLIFGLDLVSRIRLTNVDTFRYMAEIYHNHNLNSIADKFSEAAQEWTRARYILTKLFTVTANHNLKAKAADKIRSAAGIEESIRNDLIQLAEGLKEGDPCVTSDGIQNTPTEDDGEITVISLENYFNNQGFHNPAHAELKACLRSAEQQTYIVTDGFPSNQLIHKDRMMFIYPDVFSGQNDNVVCLEQCIEVPPGAYKSLMLLGFSLYKGYAGTITAIYDNNEEEEVNFALTNLGSHKPLFGDKVACKGEFTNVNSTKMKPGSIYCNEFRLKKSMDTLVALRLPDWEYLSILGISLRK